MKYKVQDKCVQYAPQLLSWPNSRNKCKWLSKLTQKYKYQAGAGQPSSCVLFKKEDNHHPSTSALHLLTCSHWASTRTKQSHSQTLSIPLMLLQSLRASLEKLFSVAWTKITAIWHISFLTQYIFQYILKFYLYFYPLLLFSPGLQASLQRGMSELTLHCYWSLLVTSSWKTGGCPKY